MTITRFAPSPTGHLHIGGLRTALYCYLYARKNKGKFLLRIEDTDKERNTVESLNGILDSFKWVGLDYDMPVFYQSQRLEIYQKYIKELLQSKKAYYCYLSHEELELNKNNRLNNNKDHASFIRKYRDCENSNEIDKNKTVAPVVRLKAPLDGKIEFYDGIKGNISIDSKEIEDFVIARSDGSPTYNFVVAIDDALSGITDIIRGDDHLSNTPKQILVYRALNFEPPKFYHVPMICNESGKKLSKRDGVVGVLEYKERGILKEALLNFLFRLGFSDGDREIFSMQDMLECFKPTEINSKPSSCNFSKLEWLNVEHMKAKTTLELVALLENKNLDSMLEQDLNNEFKISSLFKELLQRVKNLVDLNAEVDNIFQRPFKKDAQTGEIIQSYDQSMLKSFSKIQLNLLEELKDSLNIFENTEEIKIILHNFIELKEIKIGVLMQGLRLALLGKKGGIDIATCMYILGLEEVKKRIEILIENTKDSV